MLSIEYIYIYTRWSVAATLAKLLQEQSFPFHISLLFTLRRWSFLDWKVPVAATLANLLPEESSDFHFLQSVGVFRWVFTTDSVALTLATDFPTLHKHGFFFNSFRLESHIFRPKTFPIIMHVIRRNGWLFSLELVFTLDLVRRVPTVISDGDSHLTERWIFFDSFWLGPTLFRS